MAYTIEQAKECIRFSILSSDKNIKLPLAIWGYHGIGKTELVKQVAEEMQMNLVVLHLSTQDITDLIGIPREREIHINGRIEKITEWSCPSWLFYAKEQTQTSGKRNIFFLDEMNRANRAVLNAMLPFLIEGKIHTHSIGEHDVVIAAMNPSNEHYDTNDLFDKALLDRLGHIVLSPTIEEYKEFLHKQHIDPITLRLLDEQPQFASIPDIQLHFSVQPSRRKIEKVMKKFVLMDESWICVYGKYVLKCYLGDMFSSMWMKYYIQKRDASRKENQITLDHLLHIDQFKEYIDSLLKLDQGNGKAIKMSEYKKMTDILIKYFEQKEQVDFQDVDMIMKIFSLPSLHPSVYKSFFFEKAIQKHFIQSVEFNLKISKFLKEKNILTEERLFI